MDVFVSTYTIYLENIGLLNYTDILNYIMLKKHFISLVLEVSILRNSEA